MTDKRPGERNPLLAQFAVLIGFTLLVAVINGASVTTDLTNRQVGFYPWEPWCWELSSWLGSAVMIIPVLCFDAWSVAARLTWIVRLGLYALVSVLFSAGHVAIMVGLRSLIYRLHHDRYSFGPVLSAWLYEYRKDIALFVFAIGLFYAWRRASRRSGSAPPGTPQAATTDSKEPAFLAPGRDGEMLIRASEIHWVEAQGNYVALHLEKRAALVRQPLKEIEGRLRPFGFLRTHRSALINSRSVRAIRRDELGDLKVELKNGELAPLTAGHKASVVSALAGD